MTSLPSKSAGWGQAGLEYKVLSWLTKQKACGCLPWDGFTPRKRYLEWRTNVDLCLMVIQYFSTSFDFLKGVVEANVPFDSVGKRELQFYATK